MASVYIETTIPSYYFETRTSVEAVAWRRATRIWWERYRGNYDLVTSDAVLAELRRAPTKKSSRSITLLSAVEVLREPTEIAKILAYYLSHRLMPAGAGGDAYHLAMASYYSADYLLTWNCRHLANANKIKHIEVVNARLGLSVPIITTPQLLIPEIQP